MRNNMNKQISLGWVGLFLSLFFLSSTGRAEFQDKKEQEFFQQMQAKAEADRIASEMTNPKPPKVDSGRAIQGNRSAPVLIVTYSDFQCPYCRKGFQTAEALIQKYGKKVAFMFKEHAARNA